VWPFLRPGGILSTQINKEANKMMTVEQIRAALQPYNLSKVAKEAGVNKHTLYRMMNEQHKPTYETVKRLSDYLL
jgi:DNA-binding phage protein